MQSEDTHASGEVESRLRVQDLACCSGYQASWLSEKRQPWKEYLPEDVRRDRHSAALSSESQTSHYNEKLKRNLLIDI